MVPTIKHEYIKTSFQHQLIEVVDETTIFIIDKSGIHSWYNMKTTLFGNYNLITVMFV